MNDAGRLNALTRRKRDDLHNQLTVAASGVNAGTVGTWRHFDEGGKRRKTQGDT